MTKLIAAFDLIKDLLSIYCSRESMYRGMMQNLVRQRITWSTMYVVAIALTVFIYQLFKTSNLWKHSIKGEKVLKQLIVYIINKLSVGLYY